MKPLLTHMSHTMSHAQFKSMSLLSASCICLLLKGISIGLPSDTSLPRIPFIILIMQLAYHKTGGIVKHYMTLWNPCWAGVGEVLDFACDLWYNGGLGKHLVCLTMARFYGIIEGWQT